VGALGGHELDQPLELLLGGPGSDGGAHETERGDAADDDAGGSESLNLSLRVGYLPGDERGAAAGTNFETALGELLCQMRGE
jgi:hypothetical protein